MSKKKEFFHLIDGIRGLAIINMILFHFLYDVNIVFGKNPDWYKLPSVEIWQQFICITFILISGISFHFSRNNGKRGLIINLYGLGITLVTVIFMPEEAVWFGILNFIGCAIVLTCLLRRLLEKIPPLLGGTISILLFLFFRDIQVGTLGLFGQSFVEIPSSLYEMKIFTLLGLPYSGFTSSDFFPMLPWYFLFTGGFFFWKLALRTGTSRLFIPRLPLLSALGTKSIWIYLIHQPLCMLICYLLFN